MIMADNNKNKVLNVPHLRFPEFTGEWQCKAIEKVAPLQRGFDLPTQNLVEGIYPVIYSNGILQHHDKYKCEAPGLITGRSGTIGKFTYIDSGFYWPHNTSLWVTDFCGNCPKFIYYLYQTVHIEQFSTGSGVPTLNRNDVHRYKTSIPTAIVEQEKIAKFLSILDERIVTQNKIIEDLKKLKSAIVDKLYSSTNGKTYSFCQLFDVVNEKNKKLAYKNVLSASQELGMIERSNINIDIKFEQESISGYKIVRKGDYVVHLRSFQGGFAFSDTTGICSPAYTILRPNDLVVYGYLSHFFTSKPFIKSLKLVTYGIRDGRSINVDEWLDMPILLPSAQEQMRILTIVNAIDAKLHNEAKVQFCLSSQKSYLLNTMFI